jgi:hypothetical protein
MYKLDIKWKLWSVAHDCMCLLGKLSCLNILFGKWTLNTRLDILENSMVAVKVTNAISLACGTNERIKSTSRSFLHALLCIQSISYLWHVYEGLYNSSVLHRLWTLTLSDPTSDLVRQYDFRVLLWCRMTSDVVLVAFVCPLSEHVQCFSSYSMDFSHQLVQVVLFLFLHVFLF